MFEYSPAWPHGAFQVALPFRHLISAHGEPLLDEAHALLHARTVEVFAE